jgi:HSP20 family protein
MLNNKLTSYRNNRHLNNLDPFDRFMTDSFFNPFFEMGDMIGSPAFRVDVKDKRDHYQIEAELPGVSRDQIEITAQDGVLTIAANMNMEKQEEKEDYVYSERRMGRFQRSFNLDGIREEGIKAAYENGVLKLTLPKEDVKKADHARRIEIE